MMGSGIASGENRATEAVEKALCSPLLDDIDLHGASGVLVNITAGDMSLKEFEMIGEKIKDIAAPEATIIAGCIKEEESLDGELRVTLIATGFEAAAHDEVSSIEAVVTDNPNANSSIMKGGIPNMPIPQTSPTPNYYNTMATEKRPDNEHGENIDIPAFLRQQAD